MQKLFLENTPKLVIGQAQQDLCFSEDSEIPTSDLLNVRTDVRCFVLVAIENMFCNEMDLHNTLLLQLKMSLHILCI